MHSSEPHQFAFIAHSKQQIKSNLPRYACSSGRKQSSVQDQDGTAVPGAGNIVQSQHAAACSNAKRQVAGQLQKADLWAAAHDRWQGRRNGQMENSCEAQ